MVHKARCPILFLMNDSNIMDHKTLQSDSLNNCSEFVKNIGSLRMEIGHFDDLLYLYGDLFYI